MKSSKKILILGLIAVNALLLVGLLHANMAPAQAQTFKATDYIINPSRISSDTDGLFIIDLATRRMAGLKWNKTTKRMEAFGGHNLAQQFEK